MLIKLEFDLDKLPTYWSAAKLWGVGIWTALHDAKPDLLPDGVTVVPDNKVTQSDEERAEDALCRISKLVRNRDHDRRQITNAFASIRAEGSAERAHLGVCLASALKVADDRYDHIAKLEAEVAELKTRLAEHNATWMDAQPAESGATKQWERTNAASDSGFSHVTTDNLPVSRAGAKP